MKMCLVQFFAVVCMAALVLAEGIRLPPNQAIILPESVATRLARAAYGAYGPAAGFQSSSSSSSSSSSGASSGSGSAGGAPAYNAPAYSPPAYSTVPAPHCSHSYLFSCSPSLTPVPCEQRQTQSYGSSAVSAPSGYVQQANPVGAYSDIIPQYANYY